MLASILFAIGFATANERLLSSGYSRRLTNVGATEYSLQLSDSLHHSVVYFPSPSDTSEYFMKKLSSKLSANQPLFDYDASTITCAWGEGPDFWRFFPESKGAAIYEHGPTTFSNHCYTQVSFQITELEYTSVTVELSSSHPSEEPCYDTYFVAIYNRYHVFAVSFPVTKRITFDNLSDSEYFDILQNGVRVFTFCDGIEELMSDLFMTVELFFGGFGLDPLIPIFGSHTTKREEEANLEFLARAMGYVMEPRKVTKLNISPSDIHSGDFLGVIRLDGLSPIIMFGTGGRISHSTMALWIEENGTRELYILESQGGWYWPKNGLQITKWAKWIKLAENASYQIVLLPLKPEVRAKFNETAVMEWFKTVEGTPYGTHNFMFGWIDTVDQNIPPILNATLLPILLSIFEQIKPAAAKSVYGEAMNKRLGTVNLTISELAEVAEQTGRNLLQVQAMVEEEGWIYSNGVSYVCSSFVLAMYKRAGILDGFTLQATEFTPKDVTSLTLFDRNATLPKGCTDADPGQPYCQILGKYRINLGSDYASIDPYSNMNENCGALCPDYIRTPPGC